MVIVADGYDVFSISGQKFEEAKLRDVGVLKFVDQDVAVFFLERAAQLRVGFQELDGPGDQRAERNAFFFAQQIFTGAVGAGDFLLEGDFFGAFLVGVFVEGGAFDL